MPNRLAALRYPSGSGFPLATSSEVIITLGTRKPTCCNRPGANNQSADVTTAHWSSGKAVIKSRTPRTSSTPSKSIATRSCIFLASASTDKCGATRRIVSSVGRPCDICRICSASKPWWAAHKRQCRSTLALEFTNTPSISNKMASQ